VGSNSEIQGYNFYPMLHFCRKFSNGITAHNPEINWKTGEVKMTRCPPLCGRRCPKKEKVKRVVTLEEEKIIRWAIDNKKD